MAGMAKPRARLCTSGHPLVYEVNTRVLLKELSQREGKRVTLGTISDDILQGWADMGLDAIWLMGVWSTGSLGVEIARGHAGLREDYRKVLPDFDEADVIGSPYAVQAYQPSEEIGGSKGLAALHRRLRDMGLGLILDFVGNHTARDHAWVTTHPEYYVQGNSGDDLERPDAFFKARTTRSDRVIAFGRDPIFPGWTDTAQLNYNSASLRRAMIEELQAHRPLLRRRAM